MGLSHLKEYATETVSTPRGDFTVRGLALSDVTVLMQNHSSTLVPVFDKIVLRDGNFSIDDPMSMLSALASAAPEATAAIISLAADEEDISIAARFTVPVQLDALEKIVKLTFAAEGGAKKVLEMVIRVAKGLVTGVAGLQA